MSTPSLPPPVLVQAVKQLLAALRTGGGVVASGVATIVCVFAGGGSAITTSAKPVAIPIDFDARVVSWEVLADQTGSIVVDVKKATYSGFPTTSSIAGTDKPTLSSARKNTSSALTGWTKDLTDGDVLEFSVSSATTVELVTVKLRVRKT